MVCCVYAICNPLLSTLNKSQRKLGFPGTKKPSIYPKKSGAKSLRPPFFRSWSHLCFSPTSRPILVMNTSHLSHEKLAKSQNFFIFEILWRGPGVVVKAVSLESRRWRVGTTLWPSSLKLKKCLFSAHS